MNKVIGVTALQRNFRAIFEEVAGRKIPYILTRASRPEVAMIPYEDFLEFQKLQEAKMLERFDRLMEKMSRLNAAYSEEEVQADLEITNP